MICGAKGRLSAHEIWEYDEAYHIQKLIGLDIRNFNDAVVFENLLL